MNMHGIIAMMVAMLFATMASAQSPNNAVWGVNDQNQVFRWNSSRNEFEVMPGSLKQVSVGTDGEVWGIDPDGKVFRWTGSEWQLLRFEHQTPPRGVPPVAVRELDQVAVRSAQEVYGRAGIDAYLWKDTYPYAYWSFNSRGWAFISVGIDGTVKGIGSENGLAVGLPTPGSGHLKRISVTEAQRVWAIDDNAHLFHWNGDRWQHFPGDSIQDVAEAANGELWTVTSNGTVFFRNDPETLPRQISSPLLKQIAVGYAGLTDEERLQMLDAHNRERQNYPGVGALQWSPELERYAQEWAQAVASGDKSGHRPDRQNNPFKPGEVVGENMYCAFPSSGVTGVNAVNWFISEKKWYHYDQDNGGGPLGEPPGCTAPPGEACGHFTQVIWKNTQYVGCGKAISPGNTCGSPTDSVWYVCNYYPPGNWNRQKPY